MRYRRLLMAFLVATPAILGIALTVEPSISRYLQERPYRAIDLRTLGNFEFNEHNGTETDVPESLRKLDGKPVSVMGMMWSLQHSGPAALQFQLVYNIQEHRGPPRVQDRVFVHGNRGSSIEWFDRLRCPECGTPFTAPWRVVADAPLPGATPGPQQHATSGESPCVAILWSNP
jgi:hypothetical protein